MVCYIFSDIGIFFTADSFENSANDMSSFRNALCSYEIKHFVQRKIKNFNENRTKSLFSFFLFILLSILVAVVCVDNNFLLSVTLPWCFYHYGKVTNNKSSIFFNMIVMQGILQTVLPVGHCQIQHQLQQQVHHRDEKGLRVDLLSSK